MLSTFGDLWYRTWMSFKAERWQVLLLEVSPEKVESPPQECKFQETTSRAPCSKESTHSVKRLIDQEVEIESQYSQRQRGAYSPKELVTVQSLSCAPLFVTPWTAACQVPLSSTISQSLLKLMSIESVMLSNQLILCHPLSPFAFSVSQHQSLFWWVGSSHQVAKVLDLQL